MKKILIATDFSEASRSALLYGIELAKAFNARLILFSAYQMVPSPTTDPITIVTPAEMKELTQRNLDMELLAIDPQHTISISCRCEEGKAAETILKIASEEKADIIIAGMKSGGREFRKLFGSTVTALARQTSIPMLVIPEEAEYAAPQTIALASDLAPETDMQTIEALREMGNRFQSKLYIVRVIKERSHQVYEILNRPARLSKMVRSLDPKYEYEEDRNVPEALDHFITMHHIDILAMVPHKHSFFERWFTKSNTRSMIFKTHIPLLILPEVKTELQKRPAPIMRSSELF